MPSKVGEKSRQILAQRGRDRKQAQRTQALEDSPNRILISAAMAVYSMPPLNLNDPMAVAERVQWYFDQCSNNGIPPGVAGLANALGVTRATIFAWANGETRSDDKRYMYTARRALSLLEAVWESNMQTGMIDSGVGKLIGQNNFGYVTGNVEAPSHRVASAPELQSVEVIEAKYLPESADGKEANDEKSEDN